MASWILLDIYIYTYIVVVTYWNSSLGSRCATRSTTTALQLWTRHCYQRFSVIVAQIVWLVQVGRITHQAFRNNTDIILASEATVTKPLLLQLLTLLLLLLLLWLTLLLLRIPFEWIFKIFWKYSGALCCCCSVHLLQLLEATILGPRLAWARFSSIFY